MELTVLGSGAAFPAKGAEVRNPSGYALKAGKDLVLFDLGFGNLRQLARAGLDPRDITDVFLTHRHPDHVGDLAALLFLMRYDVKPRTDRLRIWGPRGIKRLVADLSEAHAPWLDPRGYRLEINEIKSGDSIKRRNWSLSCLAMPHPTPALAYRFLYKGRSFAYSGDTGFAPKLADFAGGCDLFVIECTMTEPKGAQENGHLTPELAVATLEASGCKKGLLSHLSTESARAAKKLAKGNVRLARDLMRVVL